MTDETNEAARLTELLSAASDLVSNDWERWGPKTLQAPIRRYQGAGPDALQHLEKRVREWFERLPDPEGAMVRTRSALKSLRQAGVQSITILSKHYPPQLRRIEYPPLVLHVRGSVQSLSTGVAIVGSRTPPTPGLEVAKTVATWLAEQGVPVITGMAKGIDQHAARSALDAGGQVVGLGPGNCLDESPRTSASEYTDTAQSGCIVSEVTGAFPTHKSSFLRRNRLISGLSRLVVVASSRTSGGSINQLEWAQRQLRPSIVFDQGITSDFSKEVPESRIPYHLTSDKDMVRKLVELWASPVLLAEDPAH